LFLIASPENHFSIKDFSLKKIEVVFTPVNNPILSMAESRNSNMSDVISNPSMVWCGGGAAILHKIGHGGETKTRHEYPP